MVKSGEWMRGEEAKAVSDKMNFLKLILDRPFNFSKGVNKLCCLMLLSYLKDNFKI